MFNLSVPVHSGTEKLCDVLKSGSPGVGQNHVCPFAPSIASFLILGEVA